MQSSQVAVFNFQPSQQISVYALNDAENLIEWVTSDGENWGNGYETLRIFLAFIAHHDWELRQSDVVAAYLHGELDKDTIYMKPPSGLKIKQRDINKVCHLLKGL